MGGLTGVISEALRKMKKGRSRASYQRIRATEPGYGRGRPVKLKTERMGNKRSWLFKMPKLRVKAVSPISCLARLRDAYVRMMLKVAAKGRRGGLAYGLARNAGFLKPRPSRKRNCLSDAELLCLEYLKRDTNFLMEAARIRSQASD